MRMTIEGVCHCGGLSYRLRTDKTRAQIRPRACVCAFCRKHAALCWSDPDGEAVLRIASGTPILRYRFGLRTADFFCCGRCGVYAGAVLDGDTGMRSTLNLHLAGWREAGPPVYYGGENRTDRVRRRERRWTPTRIDGLE